MGVSASLLRIFQTRKLVEENIQSELDAALLKLSYLRNGLHAAVRRARLGRSLLDKSILEWNVADRVTGLEEIRSASSAVKTIIDAISTLEAQAGAIQAEYLSAQLEKEQALSLLQAARVAETRRLFKKEQEIIDEWYRNRLHRNRPPRSEGSDSER